MLTACSTASGRDVPAPPAPPAHGDAGGVQAASSLAPPVAKKAREESVLLVPLGTFPGALSESIARALQKQFGFQVSIAPPIALPEKAYYKPRKRYRAEILAEHLLERFKPQEGTRVLGLTQVDISTTKGNYKDWGVIGLAFIADRAGLISLFRVTRNAPPALVEHRAVNTAIHELGHTLGLEHCEELGCVMQDAEGTLKNTDASDGSFGPTCRAKLRAVLPNMP